MEGQRYIIDRVGEETDLENCSVCHAISCFSCVQDYCTALEKAADGGCVFYKDAEDNRREIRRCFYRLIRHERFDLLGKYADTLAALGFMDEEMADAARQHDDLEKYRTTHYNLLLSSGWKETLTVVRPMETEEAQTEPETPREEPDEFVDNDLDQVVFPEGVTNTVIDHETAVEIAAEDQSLRQEMADKNFRENVNRDVSDREPHRPAKEYPEELEEEDFDEEGPLTFEEYLEREEEKVLAKEAIDENEAQLDQEEHNMAANGETVIVPLNFLYKRIGFAVRQKRPGDPVDLAWSVLGANIVYKAAKDYIQTLRMLWSGEYTDQALVLLIVRKWQLETWIGSNPYWRYTNLNPNRILDRCRATAEEQAREKIERMNRRIAAGIEGGEEA